VSDHSKKFLQSTLLVAVATFFSRILGLLRSSLLSAFYGATNGEGLADAYTAAFKIPDIVFTLVISGMTAVVLIPYFMKRLEDREELNRAVSGFINLFLIVLSIILLVMFFTAPWLVDNVLLQGWQDESLRKVATDLTRILLLQVLLMTVSSVFGSHLNALQTYKSYSFAMLSYNAGIIVGLAVFSQWWGIHGVSWGVVLGALTHASFMGLGSIRNGWRWKPVLPVWTKELKDLLLNAIPRVGALAAEQSARVALVSLGSFLALGSLLIYDNAENLALVSHGLVAASIATTAFPLFIKSFNNSDWVELGNTLRDKLRLLVFLAIPACFLPGVLRFETPDLLVGYLRFTPADVSLTATTLLWLAPGALFFNMTVLLVRFYYAVRKSIFPLVAAILGVLLTIAVTQWTLSSLGIASLSAGRTAGWTFQALMLLGFLIKKPELRLAATNIAKDFSLLLTAGLVSSFIAELIRQLLPIYIEGKWDSVIRIAIGTTVFFTTYFFFTVVLKIPEARSILKKFIRS